MDLIVFTVIASLICGAGLWLATRETKPSAKPDEKHKPPAS